MDYKYLVYIVIPILGAFIGWLVNFLAIKMLFQPRYPVHIFGINIQGLVPRRQQFLAEELGALAEKELLSGTHVKDGLMQGDSVQNIVGFIEDKIDDYLLNTFPDKYPITSVFFGSGRKAQIKADLINQVHTAVPELLAHYADNIDQQIDIKDIVSQKIQELDPLVLEKTMHETLDKELRQIGFLCAALGFVIGLVQDVFIIFI
jgi:uncharacterized membrane protein YheB (UPF0754 family)